MTQIKRVEEVAYENIKSRILNRTLPPGCRLVLRNLANEIGVSHGTVALVIRMLEAEGLVTNTPGLGACVRQRSFAEIEQLFEIRACMEGLAARMCAKNATNSDIALIAAADQNIQLASESGDDAERRKADIEFHFAVVKGAHCEDLERLMNYSAYTAVLANSVQLTPPTPEIARIHTPIVEAIASRDPNRAEQEGRKHNEKGFELHRSWIERSFNKMVSPDESADKLTI